MAKVEDFNYKVMESPSESAELPEEDGMGGEEYQE